MKTPKNKHRKIQKAWGLQDRKTGEVMYIGFEKPVTGYCSAGPGCFHLNGAVYTDHKLVRISFTVVKK